MSRPSRSAQVKRWRQYLADERAEAAVYLVSDRAANGTGVLLQIDGGYVAR